MKTVKKILSILLATAVLASNLNGIHLLTLQVDPTNFDFNNQEHIETLIESYNNNLRMVIIIACSVRSKKLIRKDENIKLTTNQRILHLPEEDQNNKIILKPYLVEAIDQLFQNFIDELMSLIEKMPKLFPNINLLQHQRRMGNVIAYDNNNKQILNYLDQDPDQIRVDHNLTTKDSRTVTGCGQLTRNIINVNVKFRQCLANLEIILQLLNNHVSNQEITKKTIAIPPKKQLLLTRTRKSSSSELQKRMKSVNPSKDREQHKVIKNLLSQITYFDQLLTTPHGTP